MNAHDQPFLHAVQQELVWIPSKGIGFYPAFGECYDQAYFDKYVEYADTELGRELSALRRNLVNDHTRGLVVDVGIGCGAFISCRGGGCTRGFDINPVGKRWLYSRMLWCDPTEEVVESVTFWDTLEHIQDPASILDNVTTFVFASLPLFTGPEHVLSSKHFRPAEHCWYWTRDGLIWWMGQHGFECLEHGTPESLLGREDIHTFVFRRKA